MDEATRSELMGKYPYINEAQWALISTEAYDRGHNAGQEEVNTHARSLADFVNQILTTITQAQV